MKQFNRGIRHLIVTLVAGIILSAAAYAAAPARPQNLTARLVNGTGGNGLWQVLVSWEDGDTSAAGFNIWTTMDSGATWRIRNKRTGKSGTSHTEYSSITRTGTHRIYVESFNADGVSLPSDTVSITILPFSRQTIVSGRLIDTAGTGLYGPVYAYRVLDSIGTPGETVASYARNGDYTFTNLTAGEYVFWARSDDSMHLPGYHLNGGVAVESWTNATRVRVADNDTITGVDITLVFLPGAGGSAKLSGTISDGGTARREGEIRVLGTMPVEGAPVFALDPQGEVRGFSTTDADGRFTISGLAAGTYSIFADRVGLPLVYGAATVAENTEVQIDIVVGGSASSVPAIAPAASAIAIYPNPADLSTTLRFRAIAGTTTFRLVDMQGREMMAREIVTIDGENRVEIETAGLAAGVYLLRIGSGAGAVSTMITVGR